MSAEPDHIFVCVSRGGSEADALAAFGLSEGTSNLHPGQGTACRRFFFHNAYLELLWVNDPAEAQSTTIRPTHLWDRWTGRDQEACPFGLGFRPGLNHESGVPFPAWEYRPPYLPESVSLYVATNADMISEPMLFYLPFGQRPDAFPHNRRQVLEHPAGLHEMTRIELISSHRGGRSPAFEAVLNFGIVRTRLGASHFIEVGFDGELMGEEADFRPSLPIVFRW
jgi:hypothetical protein